MKTIDELPLFPLNTVMFPDSKIPLHIFEERYKILINECISRNRSFGINLFADEKIYLTGCTSVVDEVKGRSENGEIDIVTRGIERYEIMNYEMSSDGYFTGTVKFTENSNFITVPGIFEEAVSLYNEIIAIVYKGSIKQINPDDEKWTSGKYSVSFLMAEKCGLNLHERQNLLEISNEDDRLQFILKYFESVMPKLKDAERISTIIMSDGYLSQ
ncbi:MAG: LON peptidase substrate-binding domain-containing protein [Bacteroidetes bacterium]|nr:LON peptidase substrate-binding domain-containing protein [Bacteroidota bacterium]